MNSVENYLKWLEDMNAQLDEDFRADLGLLEVYLWSLEGEHFIDMCGVWIEKLTNCEPDEKILRNKYVRLLWCQLRHGYLSEPFIEPPPQGRLEKFVLKAPSELNETFSSFDPPLSSTVRYMDCRKGSNGSQPLDVPPKSSAKESSGQSNEFTTRSLKDGSFKSSLTGKSMRELGRVVNAELYALLHQLEAKIAAFEQEKEDQILKLKERHQKELNSVNKYNQEKIQEIILNYKSMLEEKQENHKQERKSFEKHIQKVVTEKDSKLSNQQESMQAMLQDKNSEIQRLKKALQQQCTKFESDVTEIRQQITKSSSNTASATLQNEVEELRKQLKKALRAKAKYARTLEEKFLQLLKEKHAEEAAKNHVELMKQRAAITEEVFGESQSELKDALHRLEEKYKNIVATLEAQIATRDGIDKSEAVNQDISRFLYDKRRECETKQKK